VPSAESSAWISWLVHHLDTVAGISFLDANFSEFFDSVDRCLDVPVVIPVIMVDTIVLEAASGVILAVLRSWSTMEIQKNLDTVFLSITENLINVWPIVGGWHDLIELVESDLFTGWNCWHVLVICGGGWIFTYVDDVPVSHWDSEKVDTKLLGLLEIGFNDVLIEPRSHDFGGIWTMEIAQGVGVGCGDNVVVCEEVWVVE
jgi:hypothetical protein